ncbi:hypothetical protein PN36_17935 [Candidatus Thiomargarita nelsonii]|uniref:Nucleotidyltransferase family protein n=1 Tax=Candidatus Thiomargarita nelsonii TaxID=1003181 RepID=A0A4E0R2U9_9GAMM|nr:hypothetical protein PN36_17935 [Candidatus Thiomargarita nelsonii]
MNQETMGKLLLDCLHCREIDETRTAELNELRTADWESLVQFAVKQSVAPLLYHRLKTVYPKANIPASLKQNLQKFYLASVMRNTHLYSELSEVLKALRNEDIPVILLKGAHLAQTIYGNTVLRSMCDVDILIKKTDLLKAEEKLLEMGYSSSREDDIDVACAKHHHLPPLVKQGSAPIEIHWTINHPIHPFTIDTEGLWKRARPTTIAGVEVLVLSPEDLLLHLSLHSAYNNFFKQGLRSLCDIFETIRHYQNEIDWTQLEHRASQWNAKNPVYLILRLARELLPANVPDELLNALKPKKFDERLMVCANEQIFAKENDTTNILPYGNLRGLVPERQGKSVSMPKMLSPTIIAQIYKLPQNSWRIYLYYPIRLTDLFLKYSYKLVQLLFHREERVKLGEKYMLLKWLDSR